MNTPIDPSNAVATNPAQGVSESLMSAMIDAAVAAYGKSPFDPQDADPQRTAIGNAVEAAERIRTASRPAIPPADAAQAGNPWNDQLRAEFRVWRERHFPTHGDSAYEIALGDAWLAARTPSADASPIPAAKAVTDDLLSKMVGVYRGAHNRFVDAGLNPPRGNVQPDFECEAIRTGLKAALALAASPDARPVETGQIPSRKIEPPSELWINTYPDGRALGHITEAKARELADINEDPCVAVRYVRAVQSPADDVAIARGEAQPLLQRYEETLDVIWQKTGGNKSEAYQAALAFYAILAAVQGAAEGVPSDCASPQADGTDVKDGPTHPPKAVALREAMKRAAYFGWQRTSWTWDNIATAIDIATDNGEDFDCLQEWPKDHPTQPPRTDAARPVVTVDNAMVERALNVWLDKPITDHSRLMESLRDRCRAALEAALSASKPADPGKGREPPHCSSCSCGMEPK